MRLRVMKTGDSAAVQKMNMAAHGGGRSFAWGRPQAAVHRIVTNFTENAHARASGEAALDGGFALARNSGTCAQARSGPQGPTLSGQPLREGKGAFATVTVRISPDDPAGSTMDASIAREMGLDLWKCTRPMHETAEERE
jgi:hypothetical protein